VLIGVVGLIVISLVATAAAPTGPDAPTGPSRPPAGAIGQPSPASVPPTAQPSAPAPSEAAFAPTGPIQAATVTRVTDGDTIVVAIDGVRSRVRYIGMDTPEPDDPDPALRAMAERATAANRVLVEGRDVILERDISETDRFDRLLRNVWVERDGTLVMVGLELVRQGVAQLDTFPPDIRYVDRLAAAQAEARAAGIGRWAPDASAAPTPIGLVDLVDAPVIVAVDTPARFAGGLGDYTWSRLAFAGARATVRWEVSAAAATGCRVAWRLEPDSGAVIKSTVRVDAAGRERDNRRYDTPFEAARLLVASACPAWALSMQASSTSAAGGSACDGSYPGVCIPPYPPDLDCGNIAERDFVVRGSDPHGFDREGDGIGCEGQ
jgi:micrococcal nuclease